MRRRRTRVLQRFEEIGLQLMNRTGERPGARRRRERALRPRQAQDRRSDPRAGVRDRAQLRAAQPQGRREDRRRGRRAPRDLRRRAARAPGRARSSSPRRSICWRRPHGRRCREASRGIDVDVRRAAAQRVQQAVRPREPRSSSSGFAGRARALRLPRLEQRGEAAVVGATSPRATDVFDKAQNMVDHVAPKYRYGGEPIAVVQAQPLLYRDAVVDGIAFLKPPLRQVGGRITRLRAVRLDDRLRLLRPGAELRASAARKPSEVGLLLQRESLELALYTFKYWPDVALDRDAPAGERQRRAPRSTSSGATWRSSSTSRSNADASAARASSRPTSLTNAERGDDRPRGREQHVLPRGSSRRRTGGTCSCFSCRSAGPGLAPASRIRVRGIPVLCVLVLALAGSSAAAGARGVPRGRRLRRRRLARAGARPRG